MVMGFWSDFALPHVSPPSIPVLTIGNLKGGVGKTGVATYLAFALAKRQYRVLAIDLDFQSSLSTSLAHVMLSLNGEGAMNALMSNSSDIFFNNQVVSQCVPPWQTLTVVSSNLELAEVEDSLFAELAKGKAPIDPRILLARKLSDPSLKGIFDIALIDTPPRLTIAALNALASCTHVLIPSAPTAVSVKGVETYVSLLHEPQNAVCPNGRILAILPTLGLSKELSDAQKKLFHRLERDLKPVDVWLDLHIQRRAAIADNRFYGERQISELFEPLADRLINAMGLQTNGPNAGHRPDAGTRLSW
jgi:cellulose biosynthesis protein BcsQ